MKGQHRQQWDPGKGAEEEGMRVKGGERTGGRSFPNIFHSSLPSGLSWLIVVGSC